MNRHSVLVAGAALLAPACWAGGQPAIVLAELQQPHRAAEPGELLVQFMPGTTGGSVQEALARTGAHVLEHLKGQLYRVRLPRSAPLADAVLELHRLPAVDFAEPNWRYRTAAVSDDPYYTRGKLWGMYGEGSPLFTNPYGSQAAEAWAAGHASCADVMVGIIDEGAKHAHADLKANFWKNPAEIAGNGIDDDGNGHVDDTRGWDFDGNDRRTYDGPQDDHGTHVAGTIGARGGNGLGVAGVCWKVRLLNVKFLGTNGGTTANAIKAIDYLTDLKLRHGLNLVATNNSWGGGGYSQALKDSIDAAGAADILFVAAAGGSGVDIDKTPFYPAAYTSPSIIAVTSIDDSGALPASANWGAVSVDLGAPGVDIWSTVPGGYEAYTGTSMAVPHVTGALALYAQRHPGLDAAALKAAVLGAATPTDALAGKVVTGGRLNAGSF